MYVIYADGFSKKKKIEEKFKRWYRNTHTEFYLTQFAIVSEKSGHTNVLVL